MQYKGRWNWETAYNLPVKLRDWEAGLLVHQLELEKKQIEDAQNKR